MQPLCGVETFSRETLRSIFALDYPSYEIIFCLASRDDPIATLVRGAIAANPGRPARLLIGDDRISANPQTQQCRQGMEGGAPRLGDYHPVPNVLMPGDYISVCWRAGAPTPASYAPRRSALDPSHSPPRSSAPFSTPIRRVGSTQANPAVMASPGQDDAVASGDAEKGLEALKL